MKSTYSITTVIEKRYEIDGVDGYFFADNKKLYNSKTMREKKQTINNRSKGYWIGKKFYSLNKLRPLLKRPDNFKLPF